MLYVLFALIVRFHIYVIGHVILGHDDYCQYGELTVDKDDLLEDIYFVQ